MGPIQVPGIRHVEVEVKISNADRVVFPEDGLTKGDVADYYVRASSSLLPFIRGRALTVERYPKGIGEKGFMQKNAPVHFSADLIGRHEVPRSNEGTTVYPVIETADAIGHFTNLGVIAFHVPASTVSAPLMNDWIIWDLDPPQGRVDLARRAASAVRGALESFAIETMPMTSGSNGYHLRAALSPPISAEEASRIARGISALAATANPDLLTLAFRKAERGDRVFVDWLRNAPYSTSVAPWSLRARRGAPIAAPLAWEEVSTVEPNGITLRQAKERLGVGAWDGMRPADLRDVRAAVDDALAQAGIELEPFDRFRA